MVAASSRAGITIDTEAGSANELFHHSVPRDLESSSPAALSKLSRAISIVRELRDRAPDRLWFRNTDESVFTVTDELERSAGVVGCYDGLHGKECLEGHVSVVFIERHIDDRQCAGIQGNEIVASGRSGKDNSIRNARGGGSNYAMADGSMRFLRFGRSFSPVNLWAITPESRNLGIETP